MRHKYFITHSALSLSIIALLIASLAVWQRASHQATAHDANDRAAAAAKARAIESFGKLPLSFEANRGQTGSQVKFLSRGPGYDLFLTPDEAVMQLRNVEKENGRTASLRMKLVGANRKPRVTGVDELPGKSNYLLGDDPSKWRRDVPNFAKVKYEAVYPGTDLIFYGNQQQLEYDFHLAPGADPKRIRLRFAGAQKPRLDESGDLIIDTKAGEVRQHRPVVYQEIDGQRREIESGYALKGESEVAFEIGEYDAGHPLVIDPLLNYSTLLGTQSIPRAVAVDAQGNAYVCGYLPSQANFPLTPGALNIVGQNSGPAFVMKFSANMSLVYSAIFGGTTGVLNPRSNRVVLENRVNSGFAVDAAGNAYVAGYTKSTNFPTTPGAYQRTYTPSGEELSAGFVVKLNPAGNQFIYATLFGQTSPTAIAVDNAGQAYVAGKTDSRGLPTTPGAFQPALDNPYPAESIPDAFITKFSVDGGSLIYSTYLGSGGNDEAMSIAVDPAGNAYVAGTTNNGTVGGGNPDGNRFPTTPDAFKGVPDQAALGGAFVTKLNPAGTSLIYSAILPGGSGRGDQPDGGIRLALDAQGNVYVMSQTRYANFPTTPGAYQRTGGSANPNYPQDDVTLTKLNAQGSALIYSTYLGAEDSYDTTGGLAVDAAGNAHVLYRTLATKGSPAAEGVLLVKLNPAGSARLQAIPFANAYGSGLALDASGNIYLSGIVYPPFFPTTPGALQTQFIGTGQNVPTGFFARISETIGIPIPTPSPAPSPTPFPSVAAGGRITDGASNEIRGLADTTIFLINDGVLVGRGKTQQSGFYTAGVMQANQNYRVIPYRQGYAFNPPFIDYNNGPYERESSNFVGRASANAPSFPQFTSFNITGRVKTRDGRGIADARIVLGGENSYNFEERTTTDSNGNYALTVLPAGDYYINAEKEAYRFSPEGQQFKLNQNLVVDFTVEYEPNAATVVSAASYLAEIAPDAIVTAFGTDLANTTRAATTQPLPDELGGTRVMFRGSSGGTGRAPLFFVSPTQVSFLVPAGAPPGPASVQIFYPNGKVSLASFNVSRVAPGLFTADATGKGLVTAVALRVKADGSQSYEPVVRFDAAQNRLVAVPVDLGQDLGNASDQVYLLVFGTGLRYRSGMSGVSAQLGGASAQVMFAGAQGGFAGLDQCNLLLPRSLAGRGEVEVTLRVDDKTANTVKVWIK